MMNTSLEKTRMPVQHPKIRIHNFLEVELGFDTKEAILEANRCLECKHKPCVSKCPVHIDIPKFIHEIKMGHFDEAYRVITEDSMLPSVCGRVCPQESQCESVCVRSIKGESVAIGRLERFVADTHHLNADATCPLDIKHNYKKVAIIGSGPAGLSCACELLKK